MGLLKFFSRGKKFSKSEKETFKPIYTPFPYSKELIPTYDSNYLIDIARYDPDKEKRIYALSKLDGSTLEWALNNIFKITSPEVFMLAVHAHFDQNILAMIACNAINRDVCKAAVDKINDEGILKEISSKVIWSGFVLDKITDQNFIEDLVIKRKGTVQYEAVKRIKNQELITNLLKNSGDHSLRIELVQLTNDQLLLKEIAQKDISVKVVEIALARITDMAFVQTLQPRYKEMEEAARPTPVPDNW